MSGWLDPVRRALDAREGPLEVFIRDDDAGWEDALLLRLLDLAAAHKAPVDLAVIPAVTGAPLARALMARRAAGEAVGMHQHGLRHANHERTGRKCEFGPSRTGDEQRADIAAGRRLLEDRLGGAVDPIFTPPWNRCTAATADALAELGFAALSRDVTAEPFGRPGLAEPRVAFDWFAAPRGGTPTPVSRAAHLAKRAGGAATLGVMLHHAVMDDADFAGVDDLVGLLARHPMVEMRPMARVVDAMATIGGTA